MSHTLNRFYEALGGAIDPSSHDLVVIDGHLDPRRLREAVELTRSLHPRLLRRLDERPGPADAVQIRHYRLPDDDPRAIDAHLHRLLWTEPLAPSGPPIRYHVTETPRRTYLQTVHTHVYADATACYALTDDLANVYEGRRLAERPAPPTRIHCGWNSAERLRSISAGLTQMLGELTTGGSGLMRPAFQGRRPGPRRFARVGLSRRETEQLRAAARSHGCSLHGFFQLSLLRAAEAYDQRRGQRRSTLRLWDFFSLRPQLGADDHLYDCLAILYPIMLDARWSDQHVLAEGRAHIRRLRQGEMLAHSARMSALLDALPIWAFSHLWRHQFNSDVIITNPGICPSTLPRFGDAPVIDYVTFPQLFLPARLMMIFSTFRDQLRIVVIYDEDSFPGAPTEVLGPFLDKLSSLGGLAPLRAVPGFVASWQRHSPAATQRRSAG